jgi:hypothetical protein
MRLKLSELVSLMENDRTDIDSKYYIAKKAMLDLMDAYKIAGKQDESDLILQLIDDLYEIFVDVKRFKQRKGIK